MSISETTFDIFFQQLLSGNKSACIQIVDELKNQAVTTETIYEQLFQHALYKVGEYWELNKISVATEHMATAITEQLMIRQQADLFARDRIGKKAVIACVANEHHQIGAKMIADIFEMNGWDGYFVGGNTPTDDLIRFIEGHQPNLIGLSLSIYFNLPLLQTALRKISAAFPEMPIIVGGQAFRWGGMEVVEQFDQVTFIPNLVILKEFIAKKS